MVISVNTPLVMTEMALNSAAKTKCLALPVASRRKQ